MLWSRYFRREIEKSVCEAIVKAIDSKLPSMIETFIAEKLETTPNTELSREGFGWALSIALRKHWPDVDGPTATRWLWDYIGVPFGSRGYDWTYAAAQDVAREYADQFGERS